MHLDSHSVQYDKNDPGELERLEKALKEIDDAIEMQLRDKGLSQKDRGGLYKRQGEYQKRIQECNTALRDRLRATITEEQRAVLHSVAPRLNPGDLGKHPGQLVRGMSVRPEQDERLKKLGRDIQREAG